jgi:hypothetical protein
LLLEILDMDIHLAKDSKAIDAYLSKK